MNNKPFKMTLAEFNSLPVTSKCSIARQGHYLGKQYISEHYILLYKINTFFVEIYFESYTKKIIGIDSFSGLQQLYPYWNNMLKAHTRKPSVVELELHI